MADTTHGALAPTYHPLPITIARAHGTHVWDTDGNEFLDFLSGYSALNFGHLHQGLVAAAMTQLRQVTLTSRAFDHDRLEEFAQRLVEVVGPLTTGGEDSLVVPMNTGAEAVETAIKAVRKWGYDVRGVPEDQATVIVAAGNFHGRTTTLAGLSDHPTTRDGFGPFAPGFRQVPFGDLNAVADAVDDTTVAVLMEPVQGEAGVVVPPEEFWPGLRELTTTQDIALVADEVQSGLGRTGTTLACELWDVQPDLVCLGKALGGGIVPVSAVVGKPEILGVLTAGTHGSTFGGNPLACAVGVAALDLLSTGQYQARAAASGKVLAERLDALVERGLLTEARTVGLWAGIDLDPALGTGRELCEALLERGVLAKEARTETIRLSPPLSIVQPELEMALDILEESLVALRGERSAAASNEAANAATVAAADTTSGEETSGEESSGEETSAVADAAFGDEPADDLGEDLGTADDAPAGTADVADIEAAAEGKDERSELSPTAG
ncbi:ornithine--oxo-acid transaminase [Promicromonospora iranensis]|uniref:ornithine aminotransferase n=1 Tax=Promicromonospora iranensis TaxID=1105144 RepID=A0ABU2CRC5_9MICO|nr:ornithine--oxo-acid transaminase [Promicromonospora iranensis]MDR7383836.1 ornithine--oxo-acid transaminase [Promicromonospora iranensis]